MALKMFQATVLILAQIALATAVIGETGGAPPGGSSAAKERFLERYTFTELESFKLQGELGRGCNGVVTLVKHTVTNMTYSMKAIVKNATNAAELANETRILNAVDHPFILKVKFSYEDDKNLYLVTENFSGGEFFTYLMRIGKLSEDIARYCIAEIVLALEYLHTLGIILRDLKPQNIVIHSEGHLRLIDFGMAVVTHNRRASCKVKGTPLYYAPELIIGDAKLTEYAADGFSEAVDCWALGVLLHFMITTNDLFVNNEDTTEDEWYSWLENAPLDFLNELKCSENLIDLLKKLIDRDEKKRCTMEQVKEQDWFKGVIDWDNVYNKMYGGQFAPKKVDAEVNSLDKPMSIIVQ